MLRDGVQKGLHQPYIGWAVHSAGSNGALDYAVYSNHDGPLDMCMGLCLVESSVRSSSAYGLDKNKSRDTSFYVEITWALSEGLSG
ncbi:MAG: hypothetical protein Rubg2KO_33910 [Rubricoccaceae bacterium]